MDITETEDVDTAGDTTEEEVAIMAEGVGVGVMAVVEDAMEGDQMKSKEKDHQRVM